MRFGATVAHLSCRVKERLKLGLADIQIVPKLAESARCDASNGFLLIDTHL